jgi:hypothetical protein
MSKLRIKKLRLTPSKVIDRIKEHKGKLRDRDLGFSRIVKRKSLKS